MRLVNGMQHFGKTEKPRQPKRNLREVYKPLIALHESCFSMVYFYEYS